MSRPRVVAAFLALVLAGAVAAAPAQPQTSPLLIGTGYGSLGAALGIAATWGAAPEDEDNPAFVALAAAGLTLGFVTGMRLSGSVNDALGEGRPVTGGRRAAAAFGSLLGGAGLGTAAGALVSSSSQDMMKVGAVVGAVWGAVHFASGIRSLEVTPLTLVHGRPGVVLRARF